MERRRCLSAAEIEFLAENELITIVPVESMPVLDVIVGTYGPFRPLRQATVPLWLALLLKSKGKCTVKPPSWMDIEKLRSAIEEEHEFDKFSTLPFHYLETFHLLLTSARDDIPNLDAVHAAIKTLYDLRKRKAIAGLRLMNSDLLRQDYLALDNLGLMEINEIRPFFVKAYQEVRKLAYNGVSGNAGVGEMNGGV
ncbi:hypothetical protein DFJ73DRAFT_872658 [Zopfochytrium polystomum]|nr:hypothetical protein DFJ73DRAFT_872658 [Zopfochytrium polystomum]